MQKTNLAFLAYLTLFAYAQSASSITPPSNPALDHLYGLAVQDSAVVKATEISSSLVPITPVNNTLVWNADKSKLKVVTWKSQSGYQNNLLPYNQTSANEAYVVWVTAAPRIHDFCRNYLRSHPQATKDLLDLRLKQRLGLHYTWNYDVFVEMWVSPADLFRPCVDPNIDDNKCDVNFSQTLPQVHNIASYPAFYKNLYFGDFRAEPGVPWTGLGYTYDWAGAGTRNVLGESEFIIAPSSPYDIIRAVPTLQYCSS
jgi:hypothetical protein